MMCLASTAARAASDPAFDWLLKPDGSALERQCHNGIVEFRIELWQRGIDPFNPLDRTPEDRAKWDAVTKNCNRDFAAEIMACVPVAAIKNAEQNGWAAQEVADRLAECLDDLSQRGMNASAR